MHLNTIRWQLPMSYAAIALLSTLVLGGLLLITLRGYFTQRENDYLRNNAVAINPAIAELIYGGNVPREVMQAQIASYAFLSQVRIRVLDPNGWMIVDSGVPRGRSLLSFSAEQRTVSQVVTPNTASGSREQDAFSLLPSDDYAALQSFRTSIEMPQGILVNQDDLVGGTIREYFIPVITLDFMRFSADGAHTVSNGSTDISSTDASFTSTLPATGTVFGFGLGEEIDPDAARSVQSFQQPLVTNAGEFLGTLVLSDGPASGRLIVKLVANGLAVASISAIVIGVLAGFTASRRITVPLTALISATTAMAEGDLAVRAEPRRNDELGSLAVAFNAMASRIETTVVTLRRFVADAAHELHTPLTALRTSLELVDDESDHASRELYLTRAQKQTQRLQTLTDNLLDLSRIESGVSRIQYRDIEFNALVQEMSEIYASRSEHAGINFLLDLPTEPIIVYGNDGQLRRAFGNLLDNAIKFSPRGKSVEFSISRTGVGVTATVRDYGIGISKDELPFVFGRFRRGRNATGYTGSGLGLAIVKGIIESHGGSVIGETCTEGTRFTVELPLPQHARNQMEAPALSTTDYESNVPVTA